MARGYKLGSAEPKKFIMGLRTSQFVICAVAIAFAFIIMATGHIILVVPVVGIGAALAFLPFGGRNMDEWLPIFARWVLTGKSGRQYYATAPLLGHSDQRNQTLSPPPFLKGIKLLKVKHTEGREIAVIKDTTAGTYTAIIQISGKAFVLSGKPDQEDALANWGSVLARFAREGSVISRVQWIERAVPENTQAMHKYYDETRQLDPNDPIADSYNELIDMAVPVTTSHEVYLAIQISALKSGKAIKQAGGGDDGACEVLFRELQNAANQVNQSGFNVLGVLDRNQAVRLIRTTFEPDTNDEITRRLNEGLAMNEVWPMSTEVDWKYYRTDSAYHRTFWVSDFPRTEVGADFMAPLMLQSLITRTISVIMEPVAPTKAMREVETARTSFLADQELRDRAGYVLNATREREFRKLQEREQELADGHGAYRFSAYVTCSGSSEEELEYASQSIEQVSHQSHLVLRTLYGEQDTAFATALPFGRGLI
jgi:hypothetical protein